MINFIDYTKMTDEEYLQQMLKVRKVKSDNDGAKMISQYRNALQEIEEILTTTLITASYEATTNKLSTSDDIKEFVVLYEGLLTILKYSQALIIRSHRRGQENPYSEDFKIGLTD